MRSSPPEQTERDLRELAKGYDLLFEALLRDDLQRCGVLLAETEKLVTALPPPQHDTAAVKSLRVAAAASHGRVGAALAAAMKRIEGEMAKVRNGQRALRGYADRTRGIGNRLESRG
jgi:hypothetical protein